MSLVIPALAAALHYLALGIGMGGLFMRGLYLKQIALKHAGEKPSALSKVFIADNLWGLAALLWVATGLLRFLHGYEKPTEWYLYNHAFWLKMGLFLLLFALEMFPMVKLIQFRMQRRKSEQFMPAAGALAPLVRVNRIEFALLLVIPIVASLMARGIGY